MRLVNHAFIYGFFAAVLAVTAISLRPVNAAATSIIYVDDSSIAVTPDGSSWANAYPNLQDALAAAGTPTAGNIVEIWVAAGVYYPDEGANQTNDDSTETFELVPRVQLYGGFVGNEGRRASRDWETNKTVLSGDIQQDDARTDGITLDWSDIQGTNANNIMRAGNLEDEVVLDGFYVTGGQASLSGTNGTINRGAAMALSGGGQPMLTNLHIVGNTANFGGAIFYNFQVANPGQFSMTDVTFRKNRAVAGGGAMQISNATILFKDVLFSENEAGSFGGAIANSFGTLTFEDVVFENNRAVRRGGGMSSTSAEVSFTRTRFLSNSVTSNSGSNPGGGALNIVQGSATFSEVDMRGNTSASNAGALRQQNGSLVMVNSNISGNRSQNGGGGVYLGSGVNGTLTNVTLGHNLASSTGAGLATDSSNVLLQNSIVWGNTTQNGSNLTDNFLNLNGATPTIRTSIVQGSGGSGPSWSAGAGVDGGNNLDSDPKFMAPESTITTAGIYFLEPTSPAIDAGDDSADLDGSGNGATIVSQLTGDLLGNSRIAGSAVDMGAYEWQAAVVTAPAMSTLPELGGTAVFTVSTPITLTASFTIPLVSSNPAVCSVIPDSITLSGDSSSTFTVSAIDDALFWSDSSCEVSLEATESDNPDYAGFDLPNIDLTVIDNDTPALVVSANVLTITAGLSETFDVSVSGISTATITLPISSTTGCAISTSSIEIGPNSNLTESVTVTPQRPVESCTVMVGNSQSDDPNFDGLPAEQINISVDNVWPEVTVFDTSVSIAAGSSGVVDFTLNRPPSAAVVVPVSSSAGCTLSADEVIFGANSTIDSLIITPQRPAESCTISVGNSQSDEVIFDDLPADQIDVMVTGVWPVLTLSETLLSIPAHQSGTVQFSLNGSASAPVTFPVSSTAGCDLTNSSVSIPAGSFLPVSLSITPQYLATSCTITVGNSQSDDPLYDGLVGGEIDVTVTEAWAMLMVSDSSLAILEGESGSVEISLNQVPTADVILPVSSTDGCDLSISSITIVAGSSEGQQLVITPQPAATNCTITIGNSQSLDPIFNNLPSEQITIEVLEEVGGAEPFSVYLPLVVSE